MSEREFQKGDRVRYIGPYAPHVTHPFPLGTVEGFRLSRTRIWVLLDESLDGAPLYAMWPIEHTERITDE